MMLVGSLVVAPLVGAQGIPPAAIPDTQGDLVRVFLDCESAGCDLPYARSEIAFVNFVRDRTLADVHVIVTSQVTGSGRQVSMEFLGQARRAGLRDTAAFATRLGDNQDETRRAFVRTLSQGLVRYARGTTAATRLSVTYRAPAGPQGASRGVRDRWNYWVYRLRANSRLNGSSINSSTNLSGSASANRVTEAWKLMFRTSADYSEDSYELTEGKTITRTQRSLDFNGDVVKSLAAHWSTGVRLSFDKDLYRNLDAALGVMPGIEYNAFPYAEATRRQLLVRYSMGLRSFNYVDSTLYSRLRETRPQHALVVSLDAIQPWGRIGMSVNGQQFLHDARRRQFGVFGDANWRIVRGLDFNLGGGYSYIRDQLNIRRGGLTNEEIIIQLREQATDYNYFVFTGLSFTFGSAFNNVVNTRFGGGDRFLSH